ncbi:MAG: DsrE family protein [Deltaproteobacteria bacterium]|nr:DsrE family protein [Deltaproteobacteria bacterium]
MAESLGILVNSDKFLDYVVKLTEAAHKKGKDIKIFFTGDGVLLTQKKDFAKLVGQAKLSVCDVSYRSRELTGDIPGVGFKDLVTQAKNAEMIDECDRYVVL